MIQKHSEHTFECNDVDPLAQPAIWWQRGSSTPLSAGFGYGRGTCMDSEQPVLDVELIVTDLHGGHAFGIDTEDGRRFLVMDRTVPENSQCARDAAFCAYRELAIPPAA